LSPSFVEDFSGCLNERTATFGSNADLKTLKSNLKEFELHY